METEKKGVGMSSDELDKLTTGDEAGSEEETPIADEQDAGTDDADKSSETDLAEEAIAVTDEPPAEKPEDMVPATVVAKQRELRRAAEQREAELRGRLAATEEARVASTTTLEKSPLELAAEEQEVSIDEVQMDGALYGRQRKWEQQQAENKAQKQATVDRATVGEQSYRQALVELGAEKTGEGLDLETVCQTGAKYLTAGDKIDIANAGNQSAQVAYKRCRQRILESGTSEATSLRQKINAHKKTQSKPKQAPGDGSGSGSKPKPKAEDESEAEVRASTAEIMGSLDMF